MADRAPYLADADATADSFGLPRAIFRALIGTESSWNPYAVGDAGEIGLTQIKPSTAATTGFSPYVPTENLKAGAAYLKKQFDKFGNWSEALAAYNAGPGNVKAGASYATKVIKAADAEQAAIDKATKATPTPADPGEPGPSPTPSGQIMDAIGDIVSDPGIIDQVKGGFGTFGKYTVAIVVVVILLAGGVLMIGLSAWNRAKKVT
jgi:hypothetical protein